MDVAAPPTPDGHPDAQRTPAPQRTLALTGVYNFRDLGGYAARDGRTVRWHRLFRADGLDRLTTDDVEALRPYGLRTVVDLRMEHELASRGRFPVEAYPVSFHHFSVMDRTWDRDVPGIEQIPEADFLHARYSEMLAEGGPRYAAALRVLANTESLPAVFHCAAGKDRTGLLAMLVLGSIGVGHDDIVEDYALSSRALAAFRERAAEDPEAAAALAGTPTVFFAADPTAMSRLLADIEAAHGSVRDYARSLGVPDTDLTSLETALLTD
jgi:protein-tyrosine phosphatase